MRATVPAERRCAYRACQARLQPRPQEPTSAFRRRHYCSRQCYALASRTRAACATCGEFYQPALLHQCRRPVVRPEPEGYPGAAVTTYAEAPTRCDRCGGPWRRVPVGLTCATCPREVVIAEALSAHAGRGY